MTEPRVERIIVDLCANRLLLEVDRVFGAVGGAEATIDIGALGRLIGIEIAGVYLSISDPVPGGEMQGRAVEVDVETSDGGRRLAIPRRGPGWELSFPSGNQCWTQADDSGNIRSVCSVLASS